MRISTVADVRFGRAGLPRLADTGALIDTFVQWIHRRASANLL
jgi:hypothetical protein